jgi:Lectin C-type domain
MTVRFFCVSAALWIAACGISDNADFGPRARSGDGGTEAGGRATVGGAATAGNPSAGKAGAATAGKGGAPAGGSAGQPTAGTGNPGAGSPALAGAAGDSAGGAGGEPAMMPDPICGNGVVERGEECDVGSADEHDGCDAQCQIACDEHGQDVVESADHHCYAGYREAEFEAAQQDCVSRGAHLITIGSAAENEIASSFVIESKYLGGFEDVPLTSAGEGDYHWLTGESLTFENWAAGEPDSAEVRCGLTPGPIPIPSIMRCYEHCMVMLVGGRWADQRCDRVDGYICEWEPPSQP